MINKDTELIMQKICRSCMSEGAEMKSVFETKEAEKGQTLQLAEMLMACTSIQITSGDGLPVQLCLSCESKLDTAFEFKQQCEKTDTTLRELTSRPNKRVIKQESLDIVVQPDLNISEFYNDGADSDSSEGSVHKEEDDSKNSSAFACPFCQKVLRTKKGLKIHQRRHTGEKLHCCQYCQAKFTRTNHLKRHLETHNKSGPDAASHICVECGASFSKAYHLVKHKQEHKLGNIKVKNELDEDGDDELDEPSNTENNTNHVSSGDDHIAENKEKKPAIKRKRKVLRQHVEDSSKQKVNDKLVDKEKKVMECEFCDRKFKYKKSFLHHMQTEHGMSDESDVPLSTYVTKSENIKREKMENEAETASTTQKTSVDVSDAKDTTNPDNSDDDGGVDSIDDTHLLTPLDNRKIHRCHVCESMFARANHLTRHMTLHRAVLIHKCDRCDKAFATTEYLAKHTQEDHIDKPYVCTICDKPFSRGEHLIRHLKVHNANASENNLKCSICEKSFTRSDHLARHTKVHLQQDKRHVCSECGKAFNRLDNLKTHQRIHTGLKDNSRLHLCIYCGKEFNNSSNMIVHMRRHTGERPYKCSICSKGFPRSHDLKCHERTHSGEKPYLCTLCGKSFNKSNKLLRHTRVHTGERPYVCNLCGRAFTQSNDLALHMRRHTGSRPYACGVCSARFIQSGQLKAHRRSTGHWMETQPDLKGGHRVEPVTPITNPAPIKFKTHGKFFKAKQDDGEEEMKEPRILTHSVGIMGNIIQADPSEPPQPIIIESAKLLQQFHNAGFVSLTSVINTTGNSAQEHSESKFKAEVQNYIASVARENAPRTIEKIEIMQEPEVTFTTVSSASSSFTSPERYSYQNYG